jgi:GAF domain-containing protein
MSEESIRYLTEHPLAMDRGSLVGRAGLSRATQQIPDVLADPDYNRQDLQRLYGFRTTMGAPMLIDDEVVGALVVWRNEVSPFSQGEQDLVTAFAGQAAMAVNSVKLVQQLEARGAELARKVGELEALREVGEAVNSSLDVVKVLSTIAKHAVKISATDGGSIMEYDEDARCFLVRSVYQTDPSVIERLRATRIHLDETLVGRAAKLGRPLAVPTSTRPNSIHTCRCCTTPAGVRWSPYRCCAGARSSARWSSAASDRVSSRRDADAAGDVRRSVDARAAERSALSRADAAQCGARGGQPAQVRVPGQHVARVADAAQRRARLLRSAAGTDVRRAQRAPGGVSARHPRLGQAPARDC